MISYPQTEFSKRSRERVRSTRFIEKDENWNAGFLSVLLSTVNAVICLQEKAADAIKMMLRANPSWTDEQRWFFSQSVFGTVLFKKRLNYLCGNDGEDSSKLVSIYWVDIIGLDVQFVQRRFGAKLTPDALTIKMKQMQGITDVIERLSTKHSYPRWLVRLWVSQRGETNTEHLLIAMNMPGPVTLRANGALCSRDYLIEELSREKINGVPGLYSPWSIHLTERANIVGSAAWRKGLFEVQDEGSQLIVQALDIQPGHVCLDYCAGLGGKTLAMAALLEPGDRIVATDVAQAKLQALQGRVKKAQLNELKIESRLLESAEEADLKGQSFDRILVDAPCSSLGTLRRGPEQRWQLSLKAIEDYPKQQLQILKNAAEYAKPNARMVYATCTLNRSENQDVADAFLSAHRGTWEPFPVQSPYGDGDTDIRSSGSKAERETLPLNRLFDIELDPVRGSTDGFYIACFRRVQ